MRKLFTILIMLLIVSTTASAEKTYYFYEKLPAGVISGSDSDVAFGNAPEEEYTGSIMIITTSPQSLNINLTETTDVPVTLFSSIISNWDTVTVEAVVTSGASYMGAVTVSGTGTNRTVHIGSTGSNSGSGIIKLTAKINGVSESAKNIIVDIKDPGFICNPSDPLSNIAQNSGVYEITEKEQLICLSNYQTLAVLSANYKLMNDITFAGASEDWDLIVSTDSEGWKPIGNSSTAFTGNFDGNNYSITGLYINRPNTSGQAFFNSINNSNISNLGFINLNITGKSTVGGLVSVATSSIIDSCYTKGSINGGYVGGLVGDLNTSSEIRDSYSSVNISGINYTGGLAGLVQNSSTVNNSYATGSVSGSWSGGLVGVFQNSSTINNSYSTGNVTATFTAGSLLGYIKNSTINNSYATGSYSAPSHSGDMVGLSEGVNTINNSSGGVSYNGLAMRTNWDDAKWEDLSSNTPKLEWETAGNIMTNWVYECNTTNPLANIVQSSGVYEITEKKQLICLSNYQTTEVLSASYKLMNDITFSGESEDWDIYGSTDFSGWKPLGRSDNFTGSFNGNGHKITGLYINRASVDYQGFFGQTSGANISNLGLENVNVTGKYAVGGIVGKSNNSTISNVYTTGNISASNERVGGVTGILTGENGQSSIINSYSSANVNSAGYYAGGLSGTTYVNSLIDNCYATGNISGSSYVGGLVGVTNTTTIVRNSHATGGVSGSNYIGGLVGYLYYSTSINNYATGSVSGTGGYVGSVFGHITNSTVN